MKFYSCQYYWHMLPRSDSPYGETACTKRQQDLWGAQPEDVDDCSDYEKEGESA